MDLYALPPNCHSAEGPLGLAAVLQTLVDTAKQNQSELMDECYIHYRQGMQEALLRVDLSREPFHVWYCDTYGRPMPRNVKEVIAECLWVHGGEKERYLAETPDDQAPSYDANWLEGSRFKELVVDLGARKLIKEQGSFLSGRESWVVSTQSRERTLSEIYNEFKTLRRDDPEIAPQHGVLPQPVSRFGFFARLRQSVAPAAKQTESKVKLPDSMKGPGSGNQGI